MKEINLTIKDEQLRYNFRTSAFLAFIISLVKNRAIVWAILNGNMNDWHILAIETILLMIGAISGEYLFGRWSREKFMSALKNGTL